MRELHERLSALGHRLAHEGADVYDAATVAFVESFQRSRGLPLTGVVDATTWERLDEARWLLGQRLLYLTSPRLRGDDVAELQVRLAQLGFDPGRIDGIFGPLLDAAVRDFQRNRDLDASGALSKVTLQELSRVRTAHARRSLVTDARDTAGFTSTTGEVLICGAGRVLDEVAASLLESATVHVLADTPHEVAADFANHHDIALVLSIQHLASIDGVHLHYWASYRSHSRRGELLASSLAATLAQLPDGPRVEVTGMALPILRETAMTTVHIEHGTLSDQEESHVIDAVKVIALGVIHREGGEIPPGIA